jgi:UDP-N-acetylmuramate--alanine ligase
VIIFILEACEYVESFLKFSPKSSVILNIDNDHLDYFKNFDNIKRAFQKYAGLHPYDGLLVLNADDENCLDLRNFSEAKMYNFCLK